MKRRFTSPLAESLWTKNIMYCYLWEVALQPKSAKARQYISCHDHIFTPFNVKMIFNKKKLDFIYRHSWSRIRIGISSLYPIFFSDVIIHQYMCNYILQCYGLRGYDYSFIPHVNYSPSEKDTSGYENNVFYNCMFRHTFIADDFLLNYHNRYIIIRSLFENIYIAFNSLRPIGTAVNSSDFGVKLNRRQTISWNNCDLLTGTNFGEIWVNIQQFRLRKCIWKCLKIQY